MSIDRRDSSRDDDAQIRHQFEARKADDARLRSEQRTQVSSESVDRFKAAMERRGEAKQPQPERPIPERSRPERPLASQQQGILQGKEQLRDAKASDQAKLAAEQSVHEEDGATQQAASQGLKEREVRRKNDSDENSSSGSDSGSSSVASMWQAQMALRNDATAMPTAPAPVNTQVFADLIQRHVRQMAASDNAMKDSDGQVLLRMSDATLPGTDLLLSRTADGWQLRADSRSRESYDAIRRAAPELAKRFADSDLGELTIDPHFHG